MISFAKLLGIEELSDSDFSDSSLDLGSESQSDVSSTVESDDTFDGESVGSGSSYDFPDFVEQLDEEKKDNNYPEIKSNCIEEFDWDWDICDSFEPELIDFVAENVGVADSFPCNEASHEIDFFEAYFDKETLECISNAINQYYPHCEKYKNLSDFQETNINEMYSFVGVLFSMAYVNQCSKNPWSKAAGTLKKIIQKYMKMERYEQLFDLLQFTNCKNDEDPLWGIRELFNKLVEKYRKFYVPNENIILNDTLTLFKGEVGFKEYKCMLPSNPDIKIFMVCDFETGIVVNMLLYSSLDKNVNDTDFHGIGGHILKELLKDYFDKGHKVYLDYWCSTPGICKYLMERNTNCCGPLDKKYLDRAPPFQEIRKEKRGLQKSGNILVMKQIDEVDVHAVSSMHTGEIIDSGNYDFLLKENCMLIDCASDLNDKILAIEKSNLHISSSPCFKKAIWYSKVFLHLLDVTLLNSYNSYIKVTGLEKPFKKFTKDLILQLFKKYGTPINPEEK